MHRGYQAALGLLVDAYEAPSTIKGGGLGLFLGEEHLKKDDNGASHGHSANPSFQEGNVSAGSALYC